MTMKNRLLDWYLTILYGKWVTKRVPGYYRYEYYAVCRRSGDEILCDSKREADALCDCYNDMRGE